MSVRKLTVKKKAWHLRTEMDFAFSWSEKFLEKNRLLSNEICGKNVFGHQKKILTPLEWPAQAGRNVGMM